MISNGNLRNKGTSTCFADGNLLFHFILRNLSILAISLHSYGSLRAVTFLFTNIHLPSTQPCTSIHRYIYLFSQLHSPHSHHIFSTQLPTFTLLYTATPLSTVPFCIHPYACSFTLPTYTSLFYIAISSSSLPTQLYIRVYIYIYIYVSVWVFVCLCISLHFSL